MAFGYFMNMEKLSLTIAKKHIIQMTDDNFEDDIFLDKEKIISNIENGFVVITQLSSYFEGYLNTIISSCINYNGEALLKCSIEEKIDIIFMHYQKDWSLIKGQHSWEIYKKVTKVRNEMIHFKKTYIGDGTGIPDFKLGGEVVSLFFTKSYMNIILSEYIKLGDKIASVLGLKIFHDINIFECDGRDGLVNYVYDVNTINIDETRYNK
jgi:hypothetical protein